MAKFRLLADKLTADGFRFIAPIEAPVRWLELAHDPGHVLALIERRLSRSQERDFGLPVTPEVIRRGRLATGGTVLTARLALEYGIALNTAGGSHHASAGRSAGFCTFNDVAVAAALLLEEGSVRRIAVIDLDVHQGDGTARIFEHEPRVRTFSAHGARNYPADKAASDLDLALADGLGDRAYLARVIPAVDRFIAHQRPELIFYNAGVDVHRDDRLGRLSLSESGLIQRDEAVLGLAQRRSIPIAVVIGGGYQQDVAALAARHSLVHHSAARLFHGL